MGRVGAGVLKIREIDFIRQLTTFSTQGPDGARALVGFGGFFLGQLWDVYGVHLRNAVGSVRGRRPVTRAIAARAASTGNSPSQERMPGIMRAAVAFLIASTRETAPSLA